MNGSKPLHAAFFSLVFFISSFKLSSCISNNTSFCPEIERFSLLSFKKSLKDPYDILHSWAAEANCCEWKGVICNNLTGHVHQLHLRHIEGLKGTLNPSLCNLKHLTHLDLSENNLFGETIPSFIGSFVNLEYLNLGRSGFYGKVPRTIGNLSNLHTLRLGGLVDVDSLDWLSGLSQLEHLNMEGVDLSRANNWARVINSLPSLLELHFKYCSLDFLAPLDDANISTSLKYLDLSRNMLYYHPPITAPSWIFQLINLLYLDLSVNDFVGPIPTFSNITKLQHSDLSDNRFNSGIPDWFYLCIDLKFLHLGSNLLNGTISNSIGELSSLEVLVLYDNKFTGTLPQSFGLLSNLQMLYINENMLEGVVTETHFASLTKLNILSASGNSLTLKVSPNWNPPFQLTTLQLASWNFGLASQIPSWLETQKNMDALDLSNTGISGNIPSWVWKIRILTLSQNNLQGKIPYLLGPKDQYIYLGSNQFRGSLPRIADTVTHLDLSNNSFFGGLSHLLCHTTNETYKLELLHLGGNQLRGELPDCWMKWPSLIYLNLANNNMSGSIPNSIGNLANLKSLNLYNNRLSGEIPFSMHTCTKLVKMDVGDNDLNGGIPAWVGSNLPKLTFLILRSNNLSGNISAEICHLSSLQILDLSNNRFSGTIPRCIYNFTAMATKRWFARYKYSYSYNLHTIIERASVSIKGSELEYGTTLSLVTNINLSKNNLSGNIPKELTTLVELRSLNLSQNRLTGPIPDNIGDMMQLESLDFSRNSVSGQIPNSFTLLSSLNHLNLSHNSLAGIIPKSTQLQSFDASSFIGNNLCGPPLTNDCSEDGDEVDGEEDEGEIEWFYVVLSLGYSVGFSVVCTTLVLKKAWREAYFGALECIWKKFYHFMCMLRTN